MNEGRFWLNEQRGTLMAFGIFLVMFAIYVSQPSRRADRQRGPDRRQQGRAARLRGDGADAGGHHRRHRPVGRHDLHPDQLPGLLAGRRQRRRDHVRRHRRARRRAPLRRAQRRDRGLRTTAADRRHHRHRRHLLRPGAAAQALPGRLGQRGPGRRADRAPFRRGADQPGRAGRRRAGRLGAVQPLAHRPRRLCGRLLGNRRLHVGSADPHRQVRRLTHCRACLPRSAGCSSPSSPIRARRRSPAATPTRCSPSPRWCSAASRCSAARAARSAPSSARWPFAPSATCLFVFDLDPLWQPLFQGVVLLFAVSLGAFALFRVRNRLEWFE